MDGRPVSEEGLRSRTKSLSTGVGGGVPVVAARGVGVGAHEFPGRLTRVERVTIGGSVRLVTIQAAVHDERLRAAVAGDYGAFVRLVQAIERDPEAALRELRGEFALAIIDPTARTLLAAVDPFRIVPLFWAAENGTAAVASRLRCLIDLVDDLEVDPRAVVSIVGSSAVPTPRTIFRGIHKLPPGSLLRYDGERATVSRYWDLDYTEPSREPETALREEVRSVFREALELRYQADAAAGQVGAFLSGGVDSSAVVGVLTEIAGGPIKTFSIGFGEEAFNEISFARTAVEAFGAEHTEYFVKPADVVDAIPRLIDNTDEPFGNASSVPTYYCAKLAKEHGVQFMYAGDGGDELFAGNERYAEQRLFDYYYRVPALLRRLVLHPAVNTLSALGLGVAVKGKKYIRRALVPYPERIYSYGAYNTLSLAELFADDFLDAVGRDYNPYQSIHEHYEAAAEVASDELDRQLYVDLKLAIADNDLFKVTRMTEAAGVAVRYPFLDKRLVEFSTTVPAHVKMRGRRLRSFFKDACADLLPLEIRTKTKHGFGLPIPVWLRTESDLNELMRELVLSERSLQRGYFRRDAIEGLVAAHERDTTSFYGTILWNLMVLELWHRELVDARRSVNV